MNHNISLELLSKVILPYTDNLGETLKHFLEKHRNYFL